jgi:hypothetical protein
MEFRLPAMFIGVAMIPGSSSSALDELPAPQSPSALIADARTLAGARPVWIRS